MSVSLTRPLSLGCAAVLAVALAACGSSDSSTNASGSGGGDFGNCDITSKANSIDIKPVKDGTLTQAEADAVMKAVEKGVIGGGGH